jgi:hypothetical protein
MKKNPAAVELGRKGGAARAKKMTAEERSEAARQAVQARWAKLKALTEGAKALEEKAVKREAAQRKKVTNG